MVSQPTGLIKLLLEARNAHIQGVLSYCYGNLFAGVRSHRLSPNMYRPATAVKTPKRRATSPVPQLPQLALRHAVVVAVLVEDRQPNLPAELGQADRVVALAGH